jgi:uncharacterized membrane-anchored protein
MESEHKELAQGLNKVPELAVSFWIIKILATTLGETGGDAASMSMALGYLVSTLIFAAVFVTSVSIQIKAKRFQPVIYWTTIIATTTVGTTLADFCTRSLGIGYPGGSMLLLFSLLASLFVWYRSTGSVAIATVNNKKSEIFYWMTIMFSQTLGTALGDWTADSMGMGYAGAALIFGLLLLVIALLYFTTAVSRVTVFWTAFIMTRPLGAVIGDFLDKPLQNGGLALSRYTASLVLLGAIVICIFAFSHRAAKRAH